MIATHVTSTASKVASIHASLQYINFIISSITRITYTMTKVGALHLVPSADEHHDFMFGERQANVKPMPTL